MRTAPATWRRPPLPIWRPGNSPSAWRTATWPNGSRQRCRRPCHAGSLPGTWPRYRKEPFGRGRPLPPCCGFRPCRAMNFLGRCHEASIGTRSDKWLARAWYCRSAKGGDFRGAYNYAARIAAEGCIAGALHWFGHALLNAPAPERDHMVTALLSHKIGAVRALAAHANQSEGCAAGMKSA